MARKTLCIDGRELAQLSEAVLGRSGSLRFKARGFSMNPHIRDGDTIVARPVGAGGLRVGAVAIYRSASGKPVAHRVVRIGVSDPKSAVNSVSIMTGKPPLAGLHGSGDRTVVCPPSEKGGSANFEAGPNPEGSNCRPYILVRGDSSNRRIEIVESDRVLGVVAAVERGPKILRLDNFYWKMAGLLLARFPWLGPCFAGPGELIRKITATGLHIAQRSSHYRLLATAVAGRWVSYRVATLDDAAELASFYRYEGLRGGADAAARMAVDLAQLEPYGNYLCATMRGKIVGSVVIRQFPSETDLRPDWWLFGLGVKTIVRGAGIGRDLVRLALDTARRRGAARTHLLVDEDNKVALSLYSKMGFARAIIPALQARLDDEARSGNVRQIALVKQMS